MSRELLEECKQAILANLQKWQYKDEVALYNVLQKIETELAKPEPKPVAYTSEYQLAFNYGDASMWPEYDHDYDADSCTTKQVALYTFPAKAIKTGKKLFQFESEQDWINKAQRIWRRNQVTADKTICVDQLGRICSYGLHFRLAKEDNAYPIEVFLLRD
jgi:hypothetical protein